MHKAQLLLCIAFQRRENSEPLSVVQKIFYLDIQI